MRTTSSVRRQVHLLLLSMVVLVTMVAGAGGVGVSSLMDDVDILVDDLRPAAYDNVALRNDMARAQANSRGWALTKEARFLRDYRRAVNESRTGLASLRAMSKSDPELAEAVTQEARAAESWIAFADDLVSRRSLRVTGPELLEGQAAYDRFVGLNDAVSFQVIASIDRRGDHARDQARTVLVFVALVSLFGLAATALISQVIVKRTSGPLREMEEAVARLASGDLSARVSTGGPREIHGVASALNALAEENQRAREMEERVVTQLRELDRAKDDFVSTVSHELRTPLTSIAGYIELFEDAFDDEMSPQQRGMLGVVKRNVGRLRSLIEDLLTLSRVESDAFRTSFDLVDLSQLTSDVARDVAEIASRAGVEVSEAHPEQPLLVRGDAGQLSRAMLNLISNAIKFSAPGERVLLDLDTDGRDAVVSVVDRGIGIPAEELSTLGTRFYRASNAVEAEITGTGLGLRIVKTIADNHGGRLELESSQGEGTSARLRVPLATAVRRNNRPRVDITEG